MSGSSGSCNAIWAAMAAFGTGGGGASVDGKTIDLDDGGNIEIKGISGSAVGLLLAVTSTGNSGFVDPTDGNSLDINSTSHTLEIKGVSITTASMLPFANGTGGIAWEKLIDPTDPASSLIWDSGDLLEVAGFEAAADNTIFSKNGSGDPAWITAPSGLPSSADLVSYNNTAITGNPTVDTISVTAGMYVLAANQTTSAQNGLYLVPVGGGAWTLVGKPPVVMVGRGVNNSATIWRVVSGIYVCQNPTLTLGATPVNTSSGLLQGTDQNGLTITAYLPNILTNTASRIEHGVAYSYSISWSTQVRTTTWTGAPVGSPESECMTPMLLTGDIVHCKCVAGGNLYADADGRMWSAI